MCLTLTLPFIYCYLFCIKRVLQSIKSSWSSVENDQAELNLPSLHNFLCDWGVWSPRLYFSAQFMSFRSSSSNLVISLIIITINLFFLLRLFSTLYLFFYTSFVLFCTFSTFFYTFSTLLLYLFYTFSASFMYLFSIFSTSVSHLTPVRH